MSNKAHTAAVRRIAARYGVVPRPHASPHGHDGDRYDIVLPDGLIEVETSATLAQGIERLKAAAGRRFVAVTNKETLEEALGQVAGTGIGVMNSHGDIVREATN